MGQLLGEAEAGGHEGVDHHHVQQAHDALPGLLVVGELPIEEPQQQRHEQSARHHRLEEQLAPPAQQHLAAHQAHHRCEVAPVQRWALDHLLGRHLRGLQAQRHRQEPLRVLQRLRPRLILPGVDGHAAHEEVRGALVARALHAQRAEVLQRRARRAEVHGAALHDDQHLVEQVEDFFAGLVDCCQHRLLGGVFPAREVVQELCHVVRHSRVQSTGGLVGEEQRGLGEELRGEGEAPALAPGDAGADGADQSVLALAEAQFQQQRVRALSALRLGHAPHAEAALEEQVLPHREPCEELFVLKQEGAVLTDLRRPSCAVDADPGPTLQRHLPDARQALQERALAAAAGAHDRQQLPRLHAALSVLQDLGLLSGAGHVGPHDLHRQVLPLHQDLGALDAGELRLLFPVAPELPLGVVLRRRGLELPGPRAAPQGEEGQQMVDPQRQQQPQYNA
mmetsp:Transcript_18747/g.44503  ORF Transcript_18747/g.44503 Transcript_18747/m.44503 type:complete len:451 (-) Transcript_18747:1793-3145(-)